MNMLISALEIDQAEGHAIGPALHQSASLLKKDFALAAEAKAEIAQTRGEFFVVLGIMAAIAAYSIGSADENTSQIYTSFMGLVALGVALANAGFGVLRFLRLLKTARGNT